MIRTQFPAIDLSNLSRRLRKAGPAPIGVAALLVTASTLAMISGSARADCQLNGGGAATVGNDDITCDNAPAGPFGGFSALAGDDTIDIIDGVYGGLITGSDDNDLVILNGTASVSQISGGAGDDVIDLLAGTVDQVFTSTGNDVVTLNGATVTDFITGDVGDNTINLLDGSVVDVFVFAGTNTINLNGATVSGDINGGSGNDTINLDSGSANNVFGVEGDDTITLNGASITAQITAGEGNDVVNLLDGTAGRAAGFDGDDTITLSGATITGEIDGEAGSDLINLTGGLAGSVDGGSDNDLITLNGATVTGFISGGGDAGDDQIMLVSGVAGDVAGEDGNDVITLTNADITNTISGGNGEDVIDLNGGTVGGDVLGGNNNDVLTLNGTTIGQALDGGAGADVINVLAGSVGTFVDGNTGADTITLNGGTVGTFVDGGEGADVITLNGASVGGTIFGGLDDGADTIMLLGGTAGAVDAEGGNDAVTLDGATIVGNVGGGAGDDVIDLISGSFGGDLLGGDGSDDVTIQSGYDLASIVGNLDGGDDVDTADGFIDLLTIQADGTLTGENVINWEEIDVDGATVVFVGNGIVTGGGNDINMGLHAINGGVIDFDDAFAVTGTVFVDPTSTLIVSNGGTGVYSISDFAFLDGTVDFTGSTPATGDVLTVGNYDSLGARILMDAALDATQTSDLLVISGGVFTNFGFGGVPSQITITDTAAGNSGTFTGTGPGVGIPLVDNSAGGAISEGDFVLAGGPISKGPFVYSLSLESDNILYLQSDVGAQVYGYAILSEVMREEFPILRDRLGDRRYNGVGAGDPVLAATDNAGIWARIDGDKRNIEHDGDETTGEWNSSRAEAEVGVDIPMDLFGGVSVLGFSAHMVKGSADAQSGISPDPATSEVNTLGFGAGLSMAYFAGGGFYADVQGRITAWDADVEVDEFDLKQDVDALSWGLSLEFGKRFQIGTNTALTTRSQIVYTDVHFSGFTDDNGAEVDQDKSASLTIGPAVTVEHVFPDNGVSTFVDVGVRHDVLSDSSVDVSGFEFESGLDDTWGQVQFGLSAEVATGASAYVAADVGAPLSSTFGDSWSYGLEAGFRLNF